MAFILELFRSSKPGTTKARTRAWSRRGRSKTDHAASLPDPKTNARTNTETDAHDLNTTPSEKQTGKRSCSGSCVPDKKSLESDGHVLDESACSTHSTFHPLPKDDHKDDGASEVSSRSRSQQGSKRLSVLSLKAFLRSGRMSESEPDGHVLNESAWTPAPVPKDDRASEMSQSQQGSKRLSGLSLKEFLRSGRMSEEESVPMSAVSEYTGSHATNREVDIRPERKSTVSAVSGYADSAIHPVERNSVSVTSGHTDSHDANRNEVARPERKSTVSAVSGHTDSHGSNNKVAIQAEEMDSADKPSTTGSVCSDEKRKVSSRTVSTHESSRTSDTICRYPPEFAMPLDAPMPVDDLHADWYWPGILNWTQEPAHCPEGSDPFSDSKGARLSAIASMSSEHSENQTLQSVAGQPGNIVVQHPPSKSGSGIHDTSHITSRKRTSSAGSQISRTSQISRIDSGKATVAFNQLAAKLNLQLSIPVEDPVAAPSDDKPAPDNGDTRRRRRLLGRVRSVRSNLTLKAAPPPPPPRKLRRTKTFASLGRRSMLMSSLRGRSVETLARLGGHSYLMPPAALAPSPLQLPACIVATVMFLRKYARATPNVFVEPGDIKAATRLYDDFASQVLSAEKDESKIAITMRVVAMPHFESDPATAGSLPVLSVGWVLKALLAGLPGGILGSARLYQTLNAIYLAPAPTHGFPRTLTCFGGLSPVTSSRVHLIALAITALTSEMQCALICAVFGLLTELAREPVAIQEPQLQGPGTAIRADPVALPTVDGLARVIGPLLLGIEGRAAQDGAGARARARDAAPGALCMTDVEQEIEEQRVAELLLQNWTNVSRLLRRWARSGYSGRTTPSLSGEKSEL